MADFIRCCSEIQRNDQGTTKFSYYMPIEAENQYLRLMVDNQHLRLLGTSLVGNTNLREIVFHQLYLNNESEAQTLAAGIAQCKLQKLTFSGHVEDATTTHDEPGSCVRIFHNGICSSQTINSINLFWLNGPWMENFASTVLYSLRLQHLSIASIDFYGDCGLNRILSEVLIRQPSLIDLEVRDCDLGDVDSLCWTRSLHLCRSLKTLNIRHCGIGDRAAGHLAEHILHPGSLLQRLALQENQIGVAGVQSLLLAVQRHPALIELDLEGNQNMGYEGQRLIGNALPNLAHLTHINIRNCVAVAERDMDPNCEAALSYLRAKQQAEEALLNGVVRNVGIVLSMDCNEPISDVTRLHLALNNNGRYLLAAHHGLPSTIWCNILGKLHNQYESKSLIYFFLREQPSLVQPAPCSNTIISQQDANQNGLLFPKEN